MKLHLNLHLRRALAAAMCLLPAVAETTTPYNEVHAGTSDYQVKDDKGTSFLTTGETALHAYVGSTYDNSVLFGRNVAPTADSTGEMRARMLIRVDYVDAVEQYAESGIGLLLAGSLTLEGEKDKTAELGFDNLDYTIESGPSDAQIHQVNVIEVQEGSEVTLKDMSVYATHALRMEGSDTARTSLVLDNANMTVAGNGLGNLRDNQQNSVSPESMVRHAEIVLKKNAELSFLNKDSVHFEDCAFKGTGTLSNIHMTRGSVTAGNSPGQLTLEASSFNGSTLSVYFITNPTEGWDFSGANTDTEHLLSNYKVSESVTLNNISIQVKYQALNNSTYEDTTNKSALNNKFQMGASITLFTGDLSKLSGTYTFDKSLLPELDDSLDWDTTHLLTTGKIFVVSTGQSGGVSENHLAEPERIANTLVSAGDSVLHFGQLAENQAMLRPRGTTRTWSSALSSFHRLDNQPGRTGYQHETWGGAVGVDYAFTRRTVAGVAFGCSWGKNKARKGTDFYDGGRIDQNGQMLGLYGTHQFRTKGIMDAVKLSVFASHGWFDNKSRRSGLRNNPTARAGWDSTAWALGATLSRDITTDREVVFTPFAGLEYTRASMEDFTERADADQARYTTQQDFSRLAFKAGAGIRKTMGSFTPYASLTYIHDIARDTPEINATDHRSLSGKACLPGREALRLSIGTTVQLNQSWDAWAGYTAEFRRDSTEQNINVGVGYTF